MSGGFGSSDSFLFQNVLAEDVASEAFRTLKSELCWHEMMHKGGAVPRLLSIQGEISDDGTWPLYRHPTDEQPLLEPWHAKVFEIKCALERIVDQPFNHVLIQYYRSPLDYISPHSDKTLDVHRGSKIINFSLGCTRQMQLKSKEASSVGKPAQKVPLTHNSVFVLGWETNKVFLHGIKQDKRDCKLKQEDELAFDGERISLTFRLIATFVRPDGTLFGQGAKRKNDGLEAEYIDGEETEVKRLIQAFSAENKNPDFDWEQHYGCGFNVLNMSLHDDKSAECIAAGETEKAPLEASESDKESVRGGAEQSQATEETAIMGGSIA